MTLRQVSASVRVHDVDELTQPVASAARAAAQMAVKQAPFVIAHLQPTPPHSLEVKFVTGEGGVDVVVDLEAVTEVDLEPYALFAATAAGVCMTDLVEGGSVSAARVVETKGGSEQFRSTIDDARAVVLALSDTVAAGTKPDTAGRSVVDGLSAAGFEVVSYEVLSDEPSELAGRLRHWLGQKKPPELLITVGGTGLGPRDNAVDVIGPQLETEIPGLMEAARAFGQDRTPYAALSRGVAGRIGATFVLTFPGSRKGAEETMAALVVPLVHLIDVQRKTKPHTDGYK